MIIVYNKTDNENKGANVWGAINYQDFKECSFEVNDTDNYIDINVHSNKNENKHVCLKNYREQYSKIKSIELFEIYMS